MHNRSSLLVQPTGPASDGVEVAGDVADRNAEALFAAFSTTRHKMFGVARRHVGVDAAADVVQDVMTRAWLGRDRFDPTLGSPVAYLLMMTRSTAIDHVRRNTSRHTRENRVRRNEAWHSHDEALANLIRHEEEVRLLAALGRITEAERELIVTAFYGSETYPQIAVRLGVPLGTLKTRIRAALRKLRVALGDLRVETDDVSIGEALKRRTVLEQAKGIIMAVNDVDAERAFVLLAQQARRDHRDAYELASEIVSAHTAKLAT